MSGTDYDAPLLQSRAVREELDEVLEDTWGRLSQRDRADAEPYWLLGRILAYHGSDALPHDLGPDEAAPYVADFIEDQ